MNKLSCFSIGLSAAVFVLYQLSLLSLSARIPPVIRLGKLGVTSESQNNPVSTNGVNSAKTQSVRILRKIKKELESGVKQQGM